LVPSRQHSGIASQPAAELPAPTSGRDQHTIQQTAVLDMVGTVHVREGEFQGLLIVSPSRRLQNRRGLTSVASSPHGRDDREERLAHDRGHAWDRREGMARLADVALVELGRSAGGVLADVGLVDGGRSRAVDCPAGAGEPPPPLLA